MNNELKQVKALRKLVAKHKSIKFTKARVYQKKHFIKYTHWFSSCDPDDIIEYVLPIIKKKYGVACDLDSICSSYLLDKLSGFVIDADRSLVKIDNRQNAYMELRFHKGDIKTKRIEF